jgi:hypothetical protein
MNRKKNKKKKLINILKSRLRYHLYHQKIIKRVTFHL